jgi:hypothetical protein
MMTMARRAPKTEKPSGSANECAAPSECDDVVPGG